MTSHVSPQSAPDRTQVRAGVTRRMTQILVGLLIQAVILFAAAGNPGWTAAWIYLGIYMAAIAVNSLVLLPRSPELIAERGRVAGNTKRWDRMLALMVSVVGPLLTLVVAGLDARYGWSSVATPIQVGAAVAIISGYALVSWSMISNAFFSGVVRIQTERDHQVAASGQYRFVRHPGYVGMIAFNLGTPLLLDSTWGFWVAVAVVVLFVIRTSLEDATLRRELAGYEDYATRVRYRLLPGVW